MSANFPLTEFRGRLDRIEERLDKLCSSLGTAVEAQALETKCVQCGYCCSKGPCSYGEWDADKQQCAALNDDNTCAQYELISERQKYSHFPMMGSGCSSPMFNTVRDAKIEQLQKEGEPLKT